MLLMFRISDIICQHIENDVRNRTTYVTKLQYLVTKVEIQKQVCSIVNVHFFSLLAHLSVLMYLELCL